MWERVGVGESERGRQEERERKRERKTRDMTRMGGRERDGECAMH